MLPLTGVGLHPVVEIKILVKVNGTLYVTSRDAPSTINTIKDVILRVVGGDKGSLLRISATLAIRCYHKNLQHISLESDSDSDLTSGASCCKSCGILPMISKGK
jgi:hypothetical protein